MTPPSDESRTTPRRQFIGELATTAAALAAAACAPAAVASTPPAPITPAPAPTQASASPARTTWDASWMGRITAKHKAVFDSPEIDDGTALFRADSYLGSLKSVFGASDSDANVVVVLRHAAVPLLLNDAMWAKYPIGAYTKTRDSNKKVAVRNIYYQELDAQGQPKSDEQQPNSIKTLAGRGVIFLGCSLAMGGLALEMGKKTKQSDKAVYEEMKANLVPGGILMPSGFFATLMAQEAGCALMPST